MNKKVVSYVLGIMCFILTMAIIVQYKTIKNANQIVGNSANSELKTEVLKWKEKYEQTYLELTKSEKNLEGLRETASGKDNTSGQLQKELKTLNSLIGTVDVKGKGVVITVADNKNVTTETVGTLDNISNYLIHDADLLTLVNELKNAGAEAISVNDERIVNSSSITCDGNVILINGNKISSPFTIKVIGSQEAILGAIQRPGGFLELLNKYGLVTSVTKQNKVLIYKYNGVINLKNLK